jgi:S1-C subfamily serine protease
VKVEVFDYKNLSSITGRTTTDAEIVAYHEKRDLAVLKLRTNRRFENVAKLLPASRAKDVHVFDPIVVVGCGLGQPPFPTHGTISGKGGIVIDYFEYWMGNAPGIYGNSGGAVFLERSLELIGVPSRISVSGGMFGGSPITHMMYFCPPHEITRFFKDEGLHFLYDPEHEEASDLKALAEKKNKEDKDEDGK